MNEGQQVEFRIMDDAEMPPIVIKMNENDEPKVILNQFHKLCLSMNREIISGCEEALFGKIELM